MPDFSIIAATATQVADADLEGLLKQVYVNGGFTEPSAGETMFRAADVRARGDLLLAIDARGRPLGTVVTVLPGSPACRFATAGEAELQLLAVHQDHRRRGVGSALVDAALAAARRAGATRMILWTQPSMDAAHLLYLKHGFAHVPALDFSRGERRFRVFARAL